jgi:hypothetical protein|tara:strand:- start:122 stop:580 length:459 start_codon:yes stop_codon:yes gene_type:complete
MIKRILDPEEFKKLLDDLGDLFEFENKHQGHRLLKHDKEHIFRAFGKSKFLTWDFFVWGNLNSSNNFDAIIAFINNKNEKFGEEIFAEYLWLSKNPRAGRKLLATALNFARDKGFKYVMMSCVEAHPKSEKVARFYKRLGFIKDSETYIAKI